MINPCIEHSFQCELLILSLCSLRNHKNHLILNLVFTEGEDTTLPLNSVLRYSLILQLWGESLESTVITQTSPGNMTDFYHDVKRWKEERGKILHFPDLEELCQFSSLPLEPLKVLLQFDFCDRILFDFCNRILFWLLQSNLAILFAIGSCLNQRVQVWRVCRLREIISDKFHSKSNLHTAR